MSYYDSEEQLNGIENAFSEKTIRMGFIRKVYGILMVQLAITVSFICIFIYVESVKNFTMENLWMPLVAGAMVIVLMIVLVCCASVRRTHPWNLICLFLFTIAESLLLGSTSCYLQDSDAVMIAVGICAIVCLGLTIFAFQTKIDFTMMGGFLFVALLILVCFGFVLLIVGTGRVVQMVYASLGALVFSLYLIYDTQLMIGGNHKYSISPEEYVFAALNLYLDVINLFMYILQIVAAARK